MKRYLMLLACLTVGAFVHAQSPRPNVILIFIDDMGYGDVGFNGATEWKTPNLDRMADEGMIFDDFYVGCAVCSGSRTALLTGAHYRRLSMSAVLFPTSSKGLPAGWPPLSTSFSSGTTWQEKQFLVSS